MSDEEARRRLELLEDEVRTLRAFEHAPYQAIVEDMTELVVRWRPDGTRVFVNDAYCELFGLPREELVGTSFWPLVLDADRARVEERIARLRPEAPVSIGRHRARGRDGREVLMEWSDRALFDEDWNVVEYQSVGRDVTERIRMEERLRRIEQADAVARASAAIAHDLANLFVVIGGQIGLAREDPSVRGLDAAAAAAAKATALIRQLQDLRYGQAPREVTFDLNRRIEDGLELLRELGGDDLRLETALSSEPCLLVGDPDQIDQVLLNLVRNAAEAAPGVTTVVLATETVPADSLRPRHDWPEGAPERCHVLRVTDDAGGVPEALLPKMFEPDVTTKSGSRGLGLATVKAIALAHHASIHVENTAKGARFELAFPAADAKGDWQPSRDRPRGS